MSAPQITTTITPPDPGSGRAIFVAAANAMGNAMNPWATEANALGIFINSAANDADAAKVDAQTAQGLAEDARDAAIAASTMVADDYDDDGHLYEVNDLVWDAPNELYRCILGYTSDATRPSANSTNWVRVNVTPADVNAIINAAITGTINPSIDATRDVPVVTRNGALVLTDRGRLVRASGTVTIPDQASVAWPDGATVLVRNVGASAISLTPASGVTLRADGTTKTGTLSIPAYRTVTLHRDASNSWYASGAE